MKTQTLIRISGMVLLTVVVSLVTLALVYALQNHPLLTLGTIGWNGEGSF